MTREKLIEITKVEWILVLVGAIFVSSGAGLSILVIWLTLGNLNGLLATSLSFAAGVGNMVVLLRWIGFRCTKHYLVRAKDLEGHE